MERNLSFCFQYDEDRSLSPYDEDCPSSVHVVPNPHTMSKIELVLTANTCIQALTKKHGLEQALIMVTDAACGKLTNGSRFDTHWQNSEKEENEEA